jgi:hypothetical protein
VCVCVCVCVCVYIYTYMQIHILYIRRGAAGEFAHEFAHVARAFGLVP